MSIATTDAPKSTYVFTSESVTEGHPDKMCDQISDAVLDAILAKEAELEAKGYIAPSGQPADVSQVRCACETLTTTGTVFVTGEIRTQAYVDVQQIVRDVSSRPTSPRASTSPSRCRPAPPRRPTPTRTWAPATRA